jgi:CheY-like chemotaxis protein
VEDDAANREVLRLVLEMAGHVVSTASSGREALERAGEGAVDVVLLDLTLPDQSGEEVSSAIRARMTPSPRIIITSGVSVDARQAGRLGAEAVLQKPFSPDRLLAVLDSDRNVT